MRHLTCILFIFILFYFSSEMYFLATGITNNRGGRWCVGNSRVGRCWVFLEAGNPQPPERPQQLVIDRLSKTVGHRQLAIPHTTLFRTSGKETATVEWFVHLLVCNISCDISHPLQMCIYWRTFVHLSSWVHSLLLVSSKLSVCGEGPHLECVCVLANHGHTR